MQPTIAIISPGDLGTSLAVRLRSAGFPVVTTVSGRSDSTQTRCRSAGLRELDSLRDVLEEADVLLACVPPDQALVLAADVAVRRREMRSKPLLYVDLNSIGPSTVREAEARLRSADLSFADAAIHGTADRLADVAILYTSGPGAPRWLEIATPIVKTQDLGPIIGAASAMKMLLGGVSKSLAATLLELGCAAERQGTLPEFLQACRWFYPGVMQALDRTAPSYPRHAARRAGEVSEIEHWLCELGLRPRVVGATGRLLAALAAASLGEGRTDAVSAIQDLVVRAQGAGVCDAVGAADPL